MNTTLAVVDEPAELCVTLLRYAQIHGFSFSSDFSTRLRRQKTGARRDTAGENPQRRIFRTFHPLRLRTRGKNLLSLRVSQAILMTRSDRPSGCRWPAIRRVALHLHQSPRQDLERLFLLLEVVSGLDDLFQRSRQPGEAPDHQGGAFPAGLGLQSRGAACPVSSAW